MTHEEETYLLFIKNKFHWHMYRLLRGRTISENFPQIPLFVLCLIHQFNIHGTVHRSMTSSNNQRDAA